MPGHCICQLAPAIVLLAFISPRFKTNQTALTRLGGGTVWFKILKFCENWVRWALCLETQNLVLFLAPACHRMSFPGKESARPWVRPLGRTCFYKEVLLLSTIFWIKIEAKWNLLEHLHPVLFYMVSCFKTSDHLGKPVEMRVILLNRAFKTTVRAFYMFLEDRWIKLRFL